jgi:hypothetical protein
VCVCARARARVCVCSFFKCGEKVGWGGGERRVLFGGVTRSPAIVVLKEIIHALTLLP